MTKNVIFLPKKTPKRIKQKNKKKINKDSKIRKELILFKFDLNLKITGKQK